MDERATIDNEHFDSLVPWEVEHHWPIPAPASRRGRKPLAISPDGRCLVPGCEAGAKLRALCSKHYRKSHRLGFPAGLDDEQLARLAEDRRQRPHAREVVVAVKLRVLGCPRCSAH